jgi:hypothetical protein
MRATLFRTLVAGPSLTLAVIALSACATKPPPASAPKPAVAQASIVAMPPLPPLPPAPPLWQGESGPKLTAEGVVTNTGERVAGDLLTTSTYRYTRTARLDDAVTVPGREDLNLAAGTPLYARTFNFVRPAPPPSLQPSQAPRLYNWYWCAAPQKTHTICMAWVSEGRARIVRAPGIGEQIVVNHPEHNSVEIPEPQITEQPQTFPDEVSRRVLKEVRGDGIIIRNTSEGASEFFEYDMPVQSWDMALRIDMEKEGRFTPVKSADGSVTATVMTLHPLTQETKDYKPFPKN